MTDYRSQIHDLYAAEEQARESWCPDPEIDLVTAQALVDEALRWAKGRWGVRDDLTVTVEEEVTHATAAEILERWESPYACAARWEGPIWRDGSPESFIAVYTMVATDSGERTALREHLLLHELAHAVVGEWPGVVDGRWSLGPDRHGALFARRHLDLVERFHPDCLPHLVEAYREFDVEVAESDTDPASWWNLPRPTREQIESALAREEVTPPSHR